MLLYVGKLLSNLVYHALTIVRELFGNKTDAMISEGWTRANASGSFGPGLNSHNQDGGHVTSETLLRPRMQHVNDSGWYRLFFSRHKNEPYTLCFRNEGHIHREILTQSPKRRPDFNIGEYQVLSTAGEPPSSSESTSSDLFLGAPSPGV